MKWHVSKRHPGVRWHVSKRHGRVYYITYTRGGKKLWEKVGTETERYTLDLAATVRANRIQALRHGEELPRDRGATPTLEGLWPDYWQWAQSAKRSAANDETRWRLHLKPRLGSTPVDLLRAQDLERLVRELRKAGKTPATIRQVLILFGAIWKKGVEWGQIPKGIERPRTALPRPNNGRLRFLSREEVGQLLEELRPRSPQAYAVTLLGYHTGGREGELLGLSWQDVDLKRGIVTFRDTKIGDTRRVPLNRTAREYLQQTPEKDRTGLVVPTQDGRRIKVLTSAWQDAADRLFNPTGTDPRYRVVPHTLRHSFASHLVEAGESLRTVADLLGHRTLAMVMRYAHLAPGGKKRAVETLD